MSDIEPKDDTQEEQDARVAAEYEFIRDSLDEFIDWSGDALVDHENEYYELLQAHIKNIDEAEQARSQAKTEADMRASIHQGSLAKQALGAFIYFRLSKYLNDAATLRVENDG